MINVSDFAKRHIRIDYTLQNLIHVFRFLRRNQVVKDLKFLQVINSDYHEKLINSHND